MAGGDEGGVGRQHEQAIQLRRSRPPDLPFMRQMLYEAVFWRPRPDRPGLDEGVSLLGVREALDGWGHRHGDTAVVAQVGDRLAGAAWYRFYTADAAIRGFLDPTVPVVVVAVHRDDRRRGIGGLMMRWLLAEASYQGLRRVSLMVSKDNDALRLYRACGFRIHAGDGDSLLMVRDVAGP